MNAQRNTLWTAIALIAAIALAACAPAATPAPQNDGLGLTGGSDAVEATEAALEPAAEGERAGAPSFALPSPAAVGGGFAAMPTAPASAEKAGDMAAPSTSGEAGGGPVVAIGGESAPVYSPPDQQFVSITAGEVDDNADFSAYLQYRLDYHRFNGATVHDVEISERHIIRVRTQNDQPVLGADVIVFDGQEMVATLRTTATGLAYFFPLAYPQHAQAQSYTVLVQKDQASQTIALDRQSTNDLTDVRLSVSPTQPPVKLDVLFLLDATGSMGDEIDQLKNNILSISAQVAALPSRPDTRYGLVSYRDRGDDYVTRFAEFTPDVQEFQLTLQNVQAAGGGDKPESLNEALHVALNNVQWRVGNTVSLIFLVADAAPHLDYQQDYDYAVEMQNAAGLGIKIHSIAASGLEPEGEYVFRQLGQFTGGHFIFLTYADQPQTSGEPGTDLHVQEGQYSVEDLDALVVRLIQEELAQLTGQQQ